MPSSAAAVVISRTVFTPARWPTMRGRRRAFAQRPFPSMIIATCLGRRSRTISDGRDFAFLLGKGLVDPGDELVRQLLHLLGEPLQLVFRDRLAVLGGLELVVGLLPDV